MTNQEFFRDKVIPLLDTGRLVVLRRRDGKPWGGRGVACGYVEKIAEPNSRDDENQWDIVDGDRRCEWDRFCHWRSDHTDPARGIELVESIPDQLATLPVGQRWSQEWWRDGFYCTKIGPDEHTWNDGVMWHSAEFDEYHGPIFLLPPVEPTPEPATPDPLHPAAALLIERGKLDAEDWAAAVRVTA